MLVQASVFCIWSVCSNVSMPALVFRQWPGRLKSWQARGQCWKLSWQLRGALLRAMATALPPWTPPSLPWLVSPVSDSNLGFCHQHVVSELDCYINLSGWSHNLVVPHFCAYSAMSQELVISHSLHPLPAAHVTIRWSAWCCNLTMSCVCAAANIANLHHHCCSPVSAHVRTGRPAHFRSVQIRL